MGRPSKLSEAQWGEVLRMAAQGESVTALAKRYKVDKAAISRRVSQQVETVKTLAGTIARAETQFENLPKSQQIATRTLTDNLKAAGESLASGARKGAQVYDKLQTLAAKKAEKLQEDPTDTDLRTLAQLGVTANEHAKGAQAFLTATKGKDPSDQSNPVNLEAIHAKLLG